MGIGSYTMSFAYVTRGEAKKNKKSNLGVRTRLLMSESVAMLDVRNRFGAPGSLKTLWRHLGAFISDATPQSDFMDRSH